jgi:hypothetical protein
MSDELPPERPPESKTAITVEPLSIAEVAEFVDQQWRTPNCECCGKDQWSILPSEQFIPLPVSDGKVFRVLSSRIYPVFFITCRTCGNVRMISVDHIREWREKKAANNG